MDKKEMKKLERERERLERAQEQLEQERERLERERERMEDERERLEEEREEAHDHKHRVIKGKLTPEEQELLDKSMERMNEDLKKMNEELKNMDLGGLNMDKMQEKIDMAQAKIELAMDGLDEKIENSIAGIDFDKLTKDIELQMDPSTKNVGVLNLKDITTEELEKMGPIKNTGVIIVPEELMSKVSSKIVKNIGTVVPYRNGWRIYSGNTEIDKAMLEALDDPIEFIQTGFLSVNEDVEPELIKSKIKAFHNYGNIQATEETYGVLMSKCLENYGLISKNGHDEDDD